MDMERNDHAGIREDLKETSWRTASHGACT
jgi:hypothetical protein